MSKCSKHVLVLTSVRVCVCIICGMLDKNKLNFTILSILSVSKPRAKNEFSGKCIFKPSIDGSMCPLFCGCLLRYHGLCLRYHGFCLVPIIGGS